MVNRNENARIAENFKGRKTDEKNTQEKGNDGDLNILRVVDSEE